jgi:hypothetical protein
VAVYISARDHSGILVECHDDTGRDHILDEHPEMAGLEDWVRETIADPLAIYQSAQHPARRAFHRPYNFGPLLGN